jgi:hypothetical protein
MKLCHLSAAGPKATFVTSHAVQVRGRIQGLKVKQGSDSALRSRRFMPCSAVRGLRVQVFILFEP